MTIEDESIAKMRATNELRAAQLATYREQQAELAKPFRTTPTPVPVATVSSQLFKLKNLLNEITALNVANLNLGSGSQASQQVNSNLDYKLNEMYNLIKVIKDDNKYSGKLIS